MSGSTVLGLCFDTHDAARVARFWATALGRPLADGANAHDAVVLATDISAGPRLAFHQVPEGKMVNNRVHLDLITTDIDGESERRDCCVEAVGARLWRWLLRRRVLPSPASGSRPR
jgi:hypothetical protein